MRVKTNLSKLSVTEQVQLARQVVTKMTGNSNFTTPSPALAAITTAADGLEAANNAALAARASSKQATSTQVDKQLVLVALLVQEAAYVQNITVGDKTKIESSGFGVQNLPAPIGPLPAPTELAADTNTNPGTIGLKWTNVKGAVSYLVERAADGETLSWVAVGTPTKPKIVAETLTSGTRYWFRVAAVGAAGPGLWTDEISKFAP